MDMGEAFTGVGMLGTAFSLRTPGGGFFTTWSNGMGVFSHFCVSQS